MYGPVVLTADRDGVFIGDMVNPDVWILPVKDEPLTFRTVENSVKGYPGMKKTFKPFYTLEENERYFMYNEIFRPSTW